MHLSRRKLGLDTLIVLIFLALAIAAIAATFQDTSQANFNAGTFNKTVYNGTFIQLDNGTAQELPANATLDGQVNMTNNTVLLHFTNQAISGNNKTLFDSSGTGYNATCSGTTCPYFISGGKMGDGINIVRTLGNTLNVTVSGTVTYPITIMAWAKLDQAGASNGHSTIAVGQAATGVDYLIVSMWGNGSYRLDARDSSVSSAIATPNLGANTGWHHVVGVFTSATSRTLYVDGINVKSVTTSVTPVNLDRFGIGAQPRVGADGIGLFNGTIDEFAAFNTSLSAAEIYDIYNRQKGNYIDRGNFTSRVFFNSGVAYDNISWTEGIPYGEELRDGEFNENISGILGGVNMVNNTVLWHMNNDPLAPKGAETSTNIKDWSGGQDNNGTVNGAFAYVAGGPFGKGGYFNNTNPTDGTYDYITVAGWTDVRGLTNISISMWFNTYNTASAVNPLWFKAPDTGAARDTEGYLNAFNSSVVCAFYNGAGNFVAIYSAANSLKNNTWYHLVCTKYTLNGNPTGTTQELYLDSVLQDNETRNSLLSPNTTAAFHIGGSTNLGVSTRVFSGAIDEVAIFNRTLSAAEVRNIYLRGAQNLNLTVRTSADNITFTDWVGPGNSTSAKFNNSTAGSLTSLNNVSYFQYRVEFDNFATLDTPQLFNVTVNYTVLNVLPAITINSPANNSFSSSPRPGIRVTVTDPDQASTYVEIFRNGTNISYGLVQNNTITNLTWTNATTEDGIYNYFVRAYDNNSNNVSSGNMTITLVARPAVSITAPPNNTSVTNSTPTVYVTVTDFEELSTYVEIIRNGTNVSYGMQQNGTNTTRFWNNLTIADGIYTYYARAYDNSSNNVSSGNLTLVVDANAPNITQNSGSDNNTTVNRTWAFFNFTIVDGTYLENTSFQLNNSVNNTQVNYSMTKSGNNYTINLTNLASRNYSIFVHANDSTSHETRLSTIWLKVDNENPALGNITNSPNETNDLDPNSTVVNVTASVTDDFQNITGNGLTNVNLEYYYNGTNGHNTSMSNTSGNVWWGTFSVNSTANWTYRIFSNDSEGKVNRSSNTTISVAYEYTWTISPENLSTTSAAIGNNVTVANITINNTGDYAQVFLVAKDIAVVPIVVLNESSFTLAQGRQGSVQVNVTPPTIAGVYIMSIKFTANNSTGGATASPTVNYSNGTFVARGDGPFLYLQIDYTNSTVVRGETYYINVKVTNFGNESADNAWVYFDAPSDWTDVNDSRGTIGPNSTVTWSNVTISVPAATTTGTKAILAHPGFLNYKHNQTSNASTSVVITAASTTTTTTSSGGGGGAGGGGGGGSGGLSEAQKETLFGTAKVYDLVVGKDNAFPFVVGNPYVNGEMHNTSIQVTGLLSQYLRVQPNFVGKIPKEGSYPVNVLITAPAYFTEGKYDLTFTISTTVIKGVVKTKSIETTKVVLRVHEISTEEAKVLIADAGELIEKIRKAGFYSTGLESLLQQAAGALENGDYRKVQDTNKQIEELTTAAFAADDQIKKLDAEITEAGRLGASVSESLNLLTIAKASFELGDFQKALQHIKEAELTFLIETKGYFNLIYFIRSNLSKLLIIIPSAIALSILLFLYGEYSYITYELRKNSREESILIGLMKTVQRECFEEKKMSMREYGIAIQQYEQRLTEVVKNVVEFESKKSNLLKFGREEARLVEQQKRLMDMVKETQKRYMEKGDLETRIYEDKMKSFTSRLGEIEEKLAFISAQKALKKGLTGKLKRGYK